MSPEVGDEHIPNPEASLLGIGRMGEGVVGLLLEMWLRYLLLLLLLIRRLTHLQQNGILYSVRYYLYPKREHEEIFY